MISMTVSLADGLHHAATLSISCRVLRPGSAGSGRSSDPSSRGSSKPVSRANSQQLEADAHSSSSAHTLQQASQALHVYAGSGGAGTAAGPQSPDSPVGAAAGSNGHGGGHAAATAAAAAGGSSLQVPSRLGRQQQQQHPPLQQQQQPQTISELREIGSGTSAVSDAFSDDPAMMQLYTSALQRPKRGGGGGSGGGTGSGGGGDSGSPVSKT